MTQFAQHRIFDRSQFVVMIDYGKNIGIGVREMEPDDTRETIIADICTGQIDRVVSVVEFNPVEGWSRDITAEIRDDVEQTMLARAFDGVSMMAAE